MILLTVGTQLPFDRLVRAVDRIAPSVGEAVLAQIGDGTYAPTNMEWARWFKPREFEGKIAEARLIVAHAGVGSVLAAERHRKPLILFPRRAAMGEHRNDHQMATASALLTRPGVYVAQDEAELERLLRADLSQAVEPIASPARDMLLDAIESFVRERPGVRGIRALPGVGKPIR